VVQIVRFNEGPPPDHPGQTAEYETLFHAFWGGSSYYRSTCVRIRAGERIGVLGARGNDYTSFRSMYADANFPTSLGKLERLICQDGRCARDGPLSCPLSSHSQGAEIGRVQLLWQYSFQQDEPLDTHARLFAANVAGSAALALRTTLRPSASFATCELAPPVSTATPRAEGRSHSCPGQSDADELILPEDLSERLCLLAKQARNTGQHRLQKALGESLAILRLPSGSPKRVSLMTASTGSTGSSQCSSFSD
jgi:hypothetical protein